MKQALNVTFDVETCNHFSVGPPRSTRWTRRQLRLITFYVSFFLSLSLSPVEFLGIPSEIALVKFVKYDVIYLFVTRLCLPIRICFFFLWILASEKKL